MAYSYSKWTGASYSVLVLRSTKNLRRQRTLSPMQAEKSKMKVG